MKKQPLLRAQMAPGTGLNRPDMAIKDHEFGDIIDKAILRCLEGIGTGVLDLTEVTSIFSSRFRINKKEATQILKILKRLGLI